MQTLSIMSSQEDDVEAQSNLLSPLMQESPELRWAFIRKVYSILILQLLATIAFASVVASVRPIANFFCETRAGPVVYTVILILPIIVVFVLYFFRKKHPLNFILLGIFIMFYGLAFGVLCSFISGKVVIETVIATAVMVISLTAYTFWAAKRGQDFGFLAPFLACILPIFLTYTTFQIFFPMGGIAQMICSCIFVVLCCVFIIFDTTALIKQHAHDEYIWASISLYLDVIQLFLELLKIYSAISEAKDSSHREVKSETIAFPASNEAMDSNHHEVKREVIAFPARTEHMGSSHHEVQSEIIALPPRSESSHHEVKSEIIAFPARSDPMDSSHHEVKSEIIVSPVRNGDMGSSHHEVKSEIVVSPVRNEDVGSTHRDL